jgi:hypothetical protein
LIVGATLACGTGACAVVVAAVLEGRANRVCLFFPFVVSFHIHYSIGYSLSFIPLSSRNV